MTQHITAKVRLNLTHPHETRIIIRMLERDPAGNIIAKYGLAQGGEWVRVPEGAAYPAECVLPVEIYPDEGLSFSQLSLAQPGEGEG